MGNSVERVRRCLVGHGLAANIVKFENPARTAREAAAEIGCELDQIVKSMVFADHSGSSVFLFLTPGGRQVSTSMAAQLTGTGLVRAEPALVRRHTGFSIGGVAPVAHPAPVRSFIDHRLLHFAEVWAAAGTPHHVFNINPAELVRVFGAEPAGFSQ